MTNDTQATETTSTFGAKLQAAREALGLDTKDAAARLRLNEKIIIMLEKERYADDLPITFLRGYIRAYGKLLQIPDYEIKKALEPIKPKPTISETDIAKKINKSKQPVTSKNYLMQISTYLIALVVLSSVGAWWYSHHSVKDTSGIALNEAQFLTTPSDTIQSNIPPLDPTLAPAHQAEANAQASLADTQININQRTGQTTITQEQPNGQTTVIESKPAAADTNNAAAPSQAAKQKKAPANDDDEQYNDDEYTD